MSFCPTDDIHSLYLDNEMPEIYKAEYENHLKTCEACQKKLNKMKVLHELFSNDSKQITPDSHYLDQSFERLQVKMRYSSVVTNNKKKSNNTNHIKYIVPSVAAVAAAFLIAVVLPMNLNSKMSADSGAMTAHNVVSRIPSATDVSLGGGRSVVISGNIHESVLPTTGNDMGIKVLDVNNTPVSAIPTSNNNLITNYEVFTPDLGNEDKISIRIIVPGVNATPVQTEIELPLNVIMGQH